MSENSKWETQENRVDKAVGTVADALYALRRRPLTDTYIRALTVLFFFFNKISIDKVLEALSSSGIPIAFKIAKLEPWYSICWAVLIIFLFSMAVLRRMKRLAHHEPGPMRDDSPIKGLKPFGFGDAEIFRRLERTDEIIQYGDAVLDQAFRIGVLTGLSGCGKTSLIRAGLKPYLEKAGVTCVVVDLSTKDPLVSIYEDLMLQGKPSGPIPPDSLVSMLRSFDVVTVHGTLVLILDQFEQFFVQNQASTEREVFIQELKQIYGDIREVKILLAIRNDFISNLHEVQISLNYVLDVTRNYFELKKFNAAQVINIIHFVSRSERGTDLDIDDAFLNRTVTSELASEDGLISAADLQILFWIMKDKGGDRLPWFTAAGFKDVGGVEGMLEEFLRKQLFTPNSFNQRGEGLAVLLAFINQDTNVREGQLTFVDVEGRLPKDFLTNHLAQVLAWLESLRLITKIIGRDGGDPRYVLTHERLIEPVRRIEDKSGSTSRKAAVLLNRRVREWLDNNKDRNYLLSWRDLRFILRNGHQGAYGSGSDIKREYIQQSRQHGYRNFGIGVGIVVVFACGLLYLTSKPYRIGYMLKNNIAETVIPSNGEAPPRDVLQRLMKVDSGMAFKVLQQAHSGKAWAAYIDIYAENNPTLYGMQSLLPFVDDISDFGERFDAIKHLAEAFTMMHDRRGDSLFSVLSDSVDVAISHGNPESEFVTSLASALVRNKKDSLLFHELLLLRNRYVNNTVVVLLQIADSLNVVHNSMADTALAMAIGELPKDTASFNEHGLNDKLKVASDLAKINRPEAMSYFMDCLKYAESSAGFDERDELYAKISAGLAQSERPDYLRLGFELLARISLGTFQYYGLTEWKFLCCQLSKTSYAQSRGAYQFAAAQAEHLPYDLNKSLCLAMLARSLAASDSGKSRVIYDEAYHIIGKQADTSEKRQLTTLVDTIRIKKDYFEKISDPLRNRTNSRTVPDSIASLVGAASANAYRRLLIASVRKQVDGQQFINDILDRVATHDSTYQHIFYNGLLPGSADLKDPRLSDGTDLPLLEGVFIRYGKRLPSYLVDTLVGYIPVQANLWERFQEYYNMAKDDPFVLKKRVEILNDMYGQLISSKKQQKSYWQYKALCGEVATVFARLGDLGKSYTAVRLPVDQSAGYNERVLAEGEYFVVGELELYAAYKKND